MASKTIHLAFIVVILFAISSNDGVDGAIGMNWGRQNAQRLMPSMVVDLLLQNGIRDARIYSAEEDILKAFSGSEINLTISVYNFKAVGSPESAKRWVQAKSQYLASCNIRRIYLGNTVFYQGLIDTKVLNKSLDALEFLQTALDDAGYGEQIKVTIPHPYVTLIDNITKPSDAEFKGEIRQEILRLIRISQKNKVPFVIEFFPIHYVKERNLEPSFAFPDNKSTHVVTDINGAVYTNTFEFLFDSYVWALKKVGVDDLDIIVGQVGWPTDGYIGANTSSAEYFYKHLLPMVASNKGTPMRPGMPINTFVHCLTDENKNPDIYPFARHWGIYRSNGEPKYKIDLTGQGRDIYPAKAKGIMRMPERWCVYDGYTTDTEKLKQQFNDACVKADCTSLAPGGSCSHLDFFQNISYAFNMYFQSMFQNESACFFNGLGKVVVDNPSNGTCVFPVEVVKGQQVNFKTGYGERLYIPKFAATFAFMLSIFWLLV